MSSDNYQVPNLASVLQTLAGLVPPNQQSQLSQGAHTTSTDFQSRPWQPPIQTYTPPPPKLAFQQQAKVVDPATITDWSSGLRCVMKTVTKHESMLSEIRKVVFDSFKIMFMAHIQQMIKVQHEHEVQWFQGRKALLERQEARKEGQKKLDEVLKAVGGVATGTSDTSPEELQRELETFDMKVYRAQLQMVNEMSTRLKNLGVPFFGTMNDLIRRVGKEDVGGNGSHVLKGQGGTIGEPELVELQRKMITMLEDLCQE